jgi:hypothetical protein
MGGGFAGGMGGRLGVVTGGGFRSLCVAELGWNTQANILGRQINQFNPLATQRGFQSVRSDELHALGIEVVRLVGRI